MGSVHSKISGRASSRTRGWQQYTGFASLAHTLDCRARLGPRMVGAAARHYHATQSDASLLHQAWAQVGPKPSKNCESDLAVNSTGIGLVFN